MKGGVVGAERFSREGSTLFSREKLLQMRRRQINNIMKTMTAKWFVCKIRYEQVQETGLVKKVTEQYVIDAISFAEAENRFIKEMTPLISGEFEVLDISRAPFNEVFLYSDGVADKWYKVKIAYITIDEKTMAEKRTSVTYLVQAINLEDARQNAAAVMSHSLGDYVITAVNETKIMDVFMNKE